MKILSCQIRKVGHVVGANDFFNLYTWRKIAGIETVAMWTVWTLWSQVNQALTSMAAMFVVAGGIRWRERRSALRAGPSGPSTAVVGSPQETYQELVDKSEFLGISAYLQ